MKDNLENVENSNENENYSPLFSLFSYDWFLIEIGKFLISPNNDDDLTKILVLNKDINKRATIVFRKHFLNFELQKEIRELIKQRNFSKIQSIFETQSLALNPNQLTFTFDNESQITKCVHDKTVLSHLGKLENCYCSDRRNTIHFAAIASRGEGFDSLIKSVIFHPRFDPKLNNERRLLDEILNWSIVKGHLDVFRCILNRFKELSKIERAPRYIGLFSISAVLVYSRIEFWNDLLKFPSQFFFSSYDLVKPFLTLCSQHEGGIKFYEKLLVSGVIPFHNSNLMVVDSYGVEFAQLMVKYVINKRLCFDLKEPNVISILKLLLSDQENLFLALGFSYISGQIETFKELMNQFNWNDSELLTLLRDYVPLDFNNQLAHLEIMKLILSRIDEKTKLDINEIASFKHLTSLEYVQLLWNDKHVLHTEELTHKLILDQCSVANFEMLQFLISKCDLAKPTEFKIQDSTSELIKSEFRNCCWLTFVSKSSFISSTFLSGMEKVLEIKWNEKLLDLTLRVIKSQSILSWLLATNQSIDQNLWRNSDRLHFVLLKCCKYAMDRAFEKLLNLLDSTKFSIDFSRNENEAFRKLLIFIHFDTPHEMMYHEFVRKFMNHCNLKFKDEKQRKEMIELAIRTEQIPNTIARISKIKIES